MKLLKPSLHVSAMGSWAPVVESRARASRLANAHAPRNVLSAVGATCENDAFAQIFQHKGQRRCRVGHGVRA